MLKLVAIISAGIAVRTLSVDEPLKDTAYNCDSPEILKTVSALGSKRKHPALPFFISVFYTSCCQLKCQHKLKRITRFHVQLLLAQMSAISGLTDAQFLGFQIAQLFKGHPVLMRRHGRLHCDGHQQGEGGLHYPPPPNLPAGDWRWRLVWSSLGTTIF